MSDQVSALREALASARRLQRLYPLDLRQQATSVALSLGASFRSCSLVAKRLGLPPATLRSWLKSSAPPSSSFLPVVVRPSASAPASLALVLPGGARVEGLSLDDLAALCRKVSS